MQGFFTTDELKSSKVRVAANSACGRCGLYETCRTPKMEVTGEGRRRVLVIAEAPGECEDRKGIQLIGKAGQYVREVMDDLHWDLDRDCWKINAVNCRPPENATPNDVQIDACRPRVWSAIEELEPAVIIPMGGVAVKSVIGHRWKKDLGGVTRWRGWRIPDQDVMAWICPTVHPSYVLRESKTPIADMFFRADLDAALVLTEESSGPLPEYGDETAKVTILRRQDDILKFLAVYGSDIPEVALAYDYETTGLKPHRKGQEIVTCGVSTDPESATAFPLLPGPVTEAWCAVLRNPWVKLITHNQKFEETWGRVALGCPGVGHVWDTRLAAHVIDNREDATPLKFLAYVLFGNCDYDSHMDQYLSSRDPVYGGNAFNRIHEADIRDVLLYNGLDAMYTRRLADYQAWDLTMGMGIPDILSGLKDVAA